MVFRVHLDQGRVDVQDHPIVDTTGRETGPHSLTDSCDSVSDPAPNPRRDLTEGSGQGRVRGNRSEQVRADTQMFDI